MRRVRTIRNSNKDTTRKICSFSVILSMIFASFTMMIVIVPYSVKAGGGPSSPDPLQVNTSCSNDTGLSEYLDDTTFDGSIWLKVDPRTLAIPQRNRFILNFSMPSLPSGYHLYSATLRIYLKYFNYSSTTRQHGCWELDNGWREHEATWNIKRSGIGGSWSTPGGDYRDLTGGGITNADVVDVVDITDSLEGHWVAWNVTDSVQRFLDGPDPNYGWIIDDMDEGGNDNYVANYYSSDKAGFTPPHLVIVYSATPACTTNASSSIEEITSTLNGYLSYAGASSALTGFWYSSTDTTPDTGDSNVSYGNTNTETTFSKGITGLIAGERYYFKSWAKHTNFFEEASGVKSFMTKPNSTLTNDFNATTYNSTQINLTWPNRAGADGAYIEYTSGIVPNPWDPGDATKIDADGYVASTSLAHTGLTSSTTYTYKAWAYASDAGWTSNGNASAPFGDNIGAEVAVTEAPPGGGSGEWLDINRDHFMSCCGEQESLLEALDGNGCWVHIAMETHWFILDLGESYMIEQVRGRSNSDDDPIDVNIYVSESGEDFGKAIESGIATWSDTSDWVEVDITDTIGRYIKVEIKVTENVKNSIGFGSEEHFTIFDACGYVQPPTTRFYFNRGSDAETWETNYNLIYDGDENLYGRTRALTDVQLLTGNNCSGEDLGPISTVEIRTKGYYVTNAQNIILRPVFGGSKDGDNHAFVCSAAGEWSEWFDITSDTNAPSDGKWTWGDVKALCCDVQSGSDVVSFTLYCSMVQIQVTYTPLPNNAPSVYVEWPDVMINGTTYIISVNNTAIDYDGTITNYEWDLGNGTIISGEDESWVRLTYRLFSNYTINLTVTDDDNADGYDEDDSTVYHYVSVVRNDNNLGVNYVTWGANESLKASTLASHLGLDTGDTICKFNNASGDWGTIQYVYPDVGDFTIERWDYVQIVVNESHSHNFVPDSSVYTSQQKNLIFNSTNQGYNYITWSKDVSITPAEFFTTLDAGVLNGENVEINVYDSSTDTWNNYNSMYPDFATLTIINPYDVICFRAPGWSDIYYDTDDW